MTRFFVRCLALLLALSCCFAVFTIGVFAADSTPSVSATFATSTNPTGIVNFITLGLGESESFPFYCCLYALSVTFSELLRN